MTHRQEILELVSKLRGEVFFDTNGYIDYVVVDGVEWGRGLRSLIGFAEKYRFAKR